MRICTCVCITQQQLRKRDREFDRGAHKKSCIERGEENNADTVLLHEILRKKLKFKLKSFRLPLDVN